MFERTRKNESCPFVHSLALLVSFGPHLVGGFGGGKRRFLFSLHFRRKWKWSVKGNDTRLCDGWVCLTQPLNLSLLPSLPFFLFLFSEESYYFHQPPHFSQIRCICPCLAKGKKKPFCRSWISFPCPYVVFFMICSWCGITMWYFFTGAHNIARRCSDCCYWNFDYN